MPKGEKTLQKYVRYRSEEARVAGGALVRRRGAAGSTEHWEGAAREAASEPRGSSLGGTHKGPCSEGPGSAVASRGLPTSFDDAPLKIHQQKQKVSMHFTKSTFFWSHKLLWI